MIPYNCPISQDNLTLSIDNVVLDFYLANKASRDCLMKLLDILPIRYSVEVVHWNGFKPGQFKEQFCIRLQDGVSFWVGAALIGTSTTWRRCRVELNPNKIQTHVVLDKVLRFFLENTLPDQRKVTRFDLAADIPIEREHCFLVKDRRLYIERRHGQEYTQYLGAKSSMVGRVKLYNKKVESKLDHPLTRLELTLDPAIPYEKVNFPEVFYLDKAEICIVEGRITDTELFILNALVQGYGTLNDLGRKTRAKMEKLLQTYLRQVQISPKSYALILNQLREYVGETSSLPCGSTEST